MMRGDAWLMARHLEHADEIADMYFNNDPKTLNPNWRQPCYASTCTRRITGGQKDQIP